MYRGDLARDGHPPTAKLTDRTAPRLAIAWRAHLDGPVDGTPAVAAGMVIAGSAGGTLAAFDARTGATVWARHGLGAIAGSPTVAADRVYVGTLTGHVYARRLSSGDQLWDWKGPPNANVWASPVAYADLVIAGVASPYGDNPLVPGRLFGLDAATGRERWMMCVRPDCAAGGGVWSTPAIDASGRAFVGVGNPEDGLLAFDPSTGKRTWLASLYPDADRDLDIGASPVIFDLRGREVIAQAAVEGLLAVLDPATGDVVWSREIVKGSAVHGLIASPAFDGRLLYLGSAGIDCEYVRQPLGVFAAMEGLGESADWVVRARSLGRRRGVAPRHRPAGLFGTRGREWCRGVRHGRGLRRPQDRFRPRAFAQRQHLVDLRHPLGGSQRPCAGGQSGRRRRQRGGRAGVPAEALTSAPGRSGLHS